MKQTIVAVERVMNKEEAEAMDSRIMAHSGDWYRSVAPLIMEMKEREGYTALGYDSFNDYCVSIDKRMGHPQVVARLMKRATVETNLGKELPAQHAYVLARLPDAEAQMEVWEQVHKDFPKPLERNYETYVDGWFRRHEKAASTGRTKSDSDGWTKAELDEDQELSDALERVGEVYGPKDRKSIQDGTIGLSRKDIITLTAFHDSKMKEVHYLIMVNHWDVARAIKFVNALPNAKTTIHELQNHCLGTPGFYYTCSVEGFDIQIKACKALAHKVTG
jgi:hypothetical protein